MEVDGADGPFDDTDAIVLGNVRAMWDSIDPMPPELVPIVGFALQLEKPGEFLNLAARHEPTRARGERARLVTFTGTTVAVMVDITINGDNTVRLDGWITPPSRVPVELRTTARTLSTTTDDGGRFVFDGVSHGVAQLHLRTGDGVTTPSIVL